MTDFSTIECPLTLDELAHAAAIVDRRKQMRRWRLIQQLESVEATCVAEIRRLGDSDLPRDVIIERAGDFLARLAIARNLLATI